MTDTIIVLMPNKEGEYLFLQRSKNDGVDWSFPSGKREIGESKEQTVVRETLEETGILCEPVEQIGERIINEHVHLYYWRANYVSGVPRDPEDGEVKNVAFRSVAEILTLVPVERMHQSVQRELGLIS